jgi:hypothetical protein
MPWTGTPVSLRVMLLTVTGAKFFASELLLYLLFLFQHLLA